MKNRASAYVVTAENGGQVAQPKTPEVTFMLNAVFACPGSPDEVVARIVERVNKGELAFCGNFAGCPIKL